MKMWERIKSWFTLLLVVSVFSTLPVLALDTVTTPATDTAQSNTPTPMEVGITGALTMVMTYAVRKVCQMKKINLEKKPQILAWTSVAASVVGGAATTYLTGGANIWAALGAAALGWFTSQGVRKLPGLIGAR